MNKNNLFYNYFKYALHLFIILITVFIISICKRSKICIIITTIMLMFLIYFFRNTPYTFIDSNKIFISPSDGKVMDITSNGNYNRIHLYLAPYNKHFMISPVDAEVVNVYNKENKNDEERKKLVLKDTYGNIINLEHSVAKLFHWGWMLKVAVKERVKFSAKKGDKLKQGEPYGMIRFGSGMIYNIPKSYKLNVKKNDKIKIGKTIIAYKI